MGTYRSPEKDFFATSISTDFLQTPPKLLRNFVSKMPASVPQEFQKPTFTSLIHPSYAHRSGQKTPQYLQKNFRQLSTRLYRTCRQDTTLGANICKRVHSNTSLLGFTPASPEPSKMCHAKQLQTRMHVDANIHSWEYNKPACQTLIFLSVQISTQL